MHQQKFHPYTINQLLYFLMNLLSGNNDWNDFTDKIQSSISIKTALPASYFDHFYWGNIAKKASDAIDTLLQSGSK